MVKRCEDIIRKQQEEKTELQQKLENAVHFQAVERSNDEVTKVENDCDCQK